MFISVPLALLLVPGVLQETEAFIFSTLQPPDIPPLMFCTGLSFRPSQELICCRELQRGFDTVRRIWKEQEILTEMLYIEIGQDLKPKRRQTRKGSKCLSFFFFTPLVHLNIMFFNNQKMIDFNWDKLITQPPTMSLLSTLLLFPPSPPQTHTQALQTQQGLSSQAGEMTLSLHPKRWTARQGWKQGLWGLGVNSAPPLPGWVTLVKLLNLFVPQVPTCNMG